MSGEIVSLWLKPAHGKPMRAVDELELIEGTGIRGNADQGGWRHVTIIEENAWHDAEIELGLEVDPSARRANVMVRGIDLRESRGKTLRLGNTTVQIAGETRPCQLMEDAQPGLRDALRPEWRAGAFGKIIGGGVIRVGDPVALDMLVQ